MALTAYLESTGELDATFQYNVQLNDGPFGSGEVAAATVDEGARFTAPMSELRLGDPNVLDLRKQGRGTLYYTALLRAFRDAASQPPIDRGIVLGRQYYEVDPKTFEPTAKPADVAAIGDIVQVKLTLVAPTELFYVHLEDHLPAGFEAVDTSLATTSAAASGPGFEQTADEEGQDVPWWRKGWWTYWTRSRIMDDRVALFAPHLDRGTYEYTYLMRASVAGNYQVIPATVEQTYMPESYGRSAGGVFVVTP
jgi:hypothetical protein